MKRATAALALSIALLPSLLSAQLAVMIPEIQGRGASSTLENQQVETYGIVTMKKSNGFFLQLPEPGDGDPATSDGIFVFTSSTPPVNAGDLVTVRGTVKEYYGLTEISSSPFSGIVSSTGNPLPAAVTLTRSILDSNGSPSQLERLEGMLLIAPQLITCGPTDDNGDVPTVLPNVMRPFREAGIDVRSALPPGAPSGVPRFDSNPERLILDTNGRAGSTASVYTSYVGLTNVKGVLDYTFSEYRLVTDGTNGATGNASVEPLVAAATGEMTIASANLQNFLSSSPDFSTKLAKTSRTIRDVLRRPDILAVQEVGDIGVLDTLAARVNSEAGLNPGYKGYLVEANGVGGDNDIDVGFLVNEGRVQVISVTQEGAAETYTNPSTGQQALLNDRPPLVLEALVAISDAPRVRFPVTVIVNHLRSLIDIAQDPGAGPNVRAKRRAQAEYLARLVQERHEANPSERIVLVGDFNAYQFNDGYVDVVGTITGKPAASNTVTLASGDLVNPDFQDLISTVDSQLRYSYIELGNAQVLDHVIVSQAALPFASKLVYARNNSDFPSSFTSDTSRPERVSDHDFPVEYLRTPMPARFDITVPPTTRPGVPFSVTITAKSLTGSTAVDYAGGVRITSSDSAASLPGDLAFAPADAGTRTITVTLATDGTQTITATDTAFGSLAVTASVLVDSSTPARLRPIRPGR